MTTWVRVDTKFIGHPKVLDIGPIGEALWLRGLCYAGEQLTDGFIPLTFVKRMGELKGLVIAAKLVAAGLWDETEDGYQIHGFSDGPFSEQGSPVQLLRRTPAYRTWRDQVLCRDGYMCQNCGQTEGELHAHHIREWAQFPQLRFDVDNGKTLCKPCHRQFHTKAEVF